MALGSTQPLTEMSTRSISWGVKAAGAYGWPTRHCNIITSRHCNDATSHCNITISRHCSSVTLQHHNIVTLQYHDILTLQHHILTLQNRDSVTLQYHILTLQYRDSVTLQCHILKKWLRTRRIWEIANKQHEVSIVIAEQPKIFRHAARRAISNTVHIKLTLLARNTKCPSGGCCGTFNNLAPNGTMRDNKLKPL
jgi:hypothetical protein